LHFRSRTAANVLNAPSAAIANRTAGVEESPQTNGICERFHKTVLNEFYRVAFRKKVYRSIDELQADLDSWIMEYNQARPHQGRWCFGKTPMQTFLDAMPMTKEKMIAA
jgi:integrase-like protein